VNRIPKGRVATYGQVAGLAGIPGQARRVGYALSALGQGRRVAWHRVVNARGEISPRAEPGFAELQRAMLEAEGVAFGSDGRIAFARFAWQPRAPAAPRVRARRGSRAGGRARRR
jgi:methylated-DNA-protein-cysteine methyltransferase-like protein